MRGAVDFSNLEGNNGMSRRDVWHHASILEAKPGHFVDWSIVLQHGLFRVYSVFTYFSEYGNGRK